MQISVLNVTRTEMPQKQGDGQGNLCINDRNQQGGYQDGYYGTTLWSLYSITAVHPVRKMEKTT